MLSDIEKREKKEVKDKLNEMEGELKVHRITIKDINLIHINFSCSHSLRA